MVPELFLISSVVRTGGSFLINSSRSLLALFTCNTGSRFSVQTSRFKVQSSRFMVLGSRFDVTVQNSRFKV